MSGKPNYFKTTTLGDLQRQCDNIVDAVHGYKPLNGNELRVLEYLAAMDSKIIESGETMRERLKDIPNGWRQWRLMAATLSNLLVALYGKIPLKNLRHMQNICAYGEVQIRMCAPSRTPEYAMLREDDLKELMNTAIRHECGLCLKEGREIDRCPLRRAMWNIAPPMEEHPISCEYSLIAMAMNAGIYKE